MPQFYAYLWLRDDGTPYYAGKGTGQRAFWRAGHRVNPPADKSRILLFARISEDEAFATEKELIRNWGRKDNGTGCLRNLTDGGEGLADHAHSQETRRKMSLSPGNQHFRGKHHTAEAKAAMSAIRKGKKPCSDALAASLATRRRLGMSLETRKKMSDAAFKRGPEHMKKAWDTRFIKTVAWG